MSATMEQRSADWFRARLGKATASRFKDVQARIKDGSEGATRRNYRAQLVVERLTGTRIEGFETAEMRWGTEMEELARLTYELTSGDQVESVGFLAHPTLAAGASPDGLVGADGQIEIKCPATGTFIEMLRLGHMPAQYVAQVQGQLWITGREWCDFVGFDPRMPPRAQLLIDRVERDQTYIDRLADEVETFLAEVDEEEQFISNYGESNGTRTVSDQDSRQDLFA